MRALIIAAAGLIAIAAGPAPAIAQSADAGEARRLELAERYLELGQGTGMAQTMRDMFDEAFLKSEMPAEERAWLSQTLAETIEDVLDATFEGLRDEVAELFTQAELEASIAFMETPMGQSIIDKQVELGWSLQEQMAPHMIEAMAKLQTKYCARFDCSETGGGAVKR